MSSNNSLSDHQTMAGGGGLSAHYALRVALQTMKERCIALQDRLTVVEEENAILRNQSIENIKNSSTTITELNLLCQNEAENLRKQIEELSSQKLQLTEHIAMVATENRQLWSRLSQLAKDDKTKKKPSTGSEMEEQLLNIPRQSSSSSGGQNLIRSRTFTQHSPNPLLRQKHLNAVAASATVANDKSFDDLSLEEISLKDVNCNGDDNNATDENIHGDNRKISIDAVNHDGCDDDILNLVTKPAPSTSLGFAYLNDDSSDGVIGSVSCGGGAAGTGDIGTEAKKCIDGVIDIEKEVLQQKIKLTGILNALKEKKVVFQECIECKRRSDNKPEMVDKKIETKDDFITFTNFKINVTTAAEAIPTTITTTTTTTTTEAIPTTTAAEATPTTTEAVATLINTTVASSSNSNNKSSKILLDGKGMMHLNSNHYLPQQQQQQIDYLIEEKKRADKMDKMCPMCGKIFDDKIIFDEFEEHVEMHFIDDSEFDANQFERNFEMVSHAVGDF